MKDYAKSATGQAVLRLTKMLSYIYAFNKYHLWGHTINSICLLTTGVSVVFSSRSGALVSTEQSSWNHLMDEWIDE